MTTPIQILSNIRVFALPAEGPLIRTDRDAADLVGAAFSERAELIAIPASRLGDEFFDLSTRIAGAIAQKLVNYKFRAAILGDISGYLAKSQALNAFVIESNRGQHLWFVADLPALAARLEMS